jgi:NAD(P)-dependent dehydrogenase (short-subunit alcohol dehydrogenase family)
VSEPLPAFDDIKALFDLSGRTALVTGGGSGLGQAVAWGLASFGADIAIADINPVSAAASAQAIAATGRRTTALTIDVADEASVASAAAKAASDLGPIDILVNAAGGNCRKPVVEMTAAEFDTQISVHLRGTFLCSKAVAPGMIAAGRGSIINFASIMGVVAMANVSAYAAAKGGIIQLTKSMAVEFAASGIRVNAIAPGFYDTPLTRQHDESARRAFADKIPLKRFGAVSEIIGPALILASQAGSYMTGTVLFTDGGWTAV